MKDYSFLNQPMGQFAVEVIGGIRYLIIWAEEQIGLPGWLLIRPLEADVPWPQ